MSSLSLSSLKQEGQTTLILAFPLIAGQLSQMLTFLADTIMIGRLGTVPLASATFANTLLHVPFLFGMGMVVAVSIRVSQARGANDPAGARAAFRHGLYISLAMGVLTLLGAWMLLPTLKWFRQEPEVVAAVPTYFLLVAASMIPAFGSLTVKNHADAMNHAWPPFWIMLGGVLLNIFLNWILIYGEWGAPRMELAGAGWATLISRVLTIAALLYWSAHFPPIKDWVPNHWFRVPDWEAVRHLIKVGLPASMQFLAEMSAFTFATLMIGTLGAAALASHQVAIACVATIFMIPLGLSMALTVRMGEAMGAKRYDSMQPIVVGGWIMATIFSFFSALLFLLFNESIASWFVQEREALKLAAMLMMVAAAFQLFDGLQIVSAGALRGLDDVTVPAWIAFMAYWVISLPIGAFLALRQGLGVAGVWWGITVGLAITAVALGIRLWRKCHEQRPDIEPDLELETTEEHQPEIVDYQGVNP